MILDTGAEVTVLSAARAETLKLPLSKSNARFAGADAANRTPMRATLPDVAFGKAAMPRLPVMVLPLKQVFKIIGEGEAKPIDGILGADVLERGGAIFDIAADTLYLTGGKSAAPAGNPSAK